jgi:hypothetical protein
MTITLPNLRIGNPVCHEALSVFPLFTDTNAGIEYRLSTEALADDSVVVEEISEGGSVPDLSVENKGDVRVLFIEGEELIGAKQNRILNTSVLIAAHAKTKIPVSCVEQGRWRYRSRGFGSSGAHSPSKLRRALKASVSESVRKKRGHRSDQGEVWREVACLHASHKVSSSTAAMSDCFDTHRDRIADFRERLQYVDGATGMAVAVGGNVVSVDVFDKPDTCRKVWDRLLSGVVFDALEVGKADQPVDTATVERLLESSRSLSWEPTNAVGEGEEYRASSPQGDHASALVLDGVLVHGSVLAV